MDLDQFPLGSFEVDCDGSACGSASAGRHIHPPQRQSWWQTGAAIARVRIVHGKRVEYSEAEGVERLVMA